MSDAFQHNTNEQISEKLPPDQQINVIVKPPKCWTPFKTDADIRANRLLPKSILHWFSAVMQEITKVLLTQNYEPVLCKTCCDMRSIVHAPFHFTIIQSLHHFYVFILTLGRNNDENLVILTQFCSRIGLYSFVVRRSADRKAIIVIFICTWSRPTDLQ